MTITAETFPVDYDVNQFNCCLSASTVKNSLASITGKVDEESHLSIILSKLREVSDAGLMSILRTDVSKSIGSRRLQSDKNAEATKEINETTDVVVASPDLFLFCY